MQGGEPDHTTVAKMMLNDFQRGKIPFYTLPPGCDKPPENEEESLAEETGNDGAMYWMLFVSEAFIMHRHCRIGRR